MACGGFPIHETVLLYDGALVNKIVRSIVGLGVVVQPHSLARAVVQQRGRERRVGHLCREVALAYSYRPDHAAPGRIMR